MEPAQQVYARAWRAYVAGDLEAASREASTYAGYARKAPDSYWTWSLKLLDAETLGAQAKGARAHELLLDPVPARPELSQLEARRLIDLASTDRRLKGEASKVRGLLDQAGAAVRDPEQRVHLDLVEGVLAMDRDDAEAEKRWFGAGADLAAKEGLPYWQALALNNLSHPLKSQGRYEESIDTGLRALDAAEKIGARRVAALAHLNVGSACAILGDFDSAFEHLGQAGKVFEAIGAKAELMNTLGELGLAHDGADDLGSAVSDYRKAYGIAQESGDTRAAARFAGNLALTLINARNWGEAEEWNRRATEFARALDARDSLPYLERNRALIAEGRGDAGTATRICRGLLRDGGTPAGIQWVAWAALGEIAADGKHFREADGYFEKALKIVEARRRDLLDPGHRMTLLSQLMPFYRSYVDVLWQQKDDALALRVVESSRARVLAERLEQDIATAPTRGLAGLMRVARDAHASILSFWLAPERSFAWLITARSVERFALPGSAAIEKLVTRYRETVEHSVRDPAANPAGAELWRILLEPVAPHLAKGARLIVIPDGALHRLNLETLIAPAPRAHYWIEDVEMAVSPSIAILAAAPPARRTGGAALLLIGAPDYAGSGYQALPNADREIREIAADFPGRTPLQYIHAQATPAVYQQADPGRFSLIHFAAHAEANAQKPLESAVILSHGGKLYAHDVVGIPIHAELVTISGCRSAGSRAYAGEGLVGFAWAFMRAGARAVAAGLWEVSDSSTEQLMNEFYRRMKEGADPVAAMHGAKLALVGSANFARPYYWAPFQIYVASMGR